jgi:serine-threonine kinase receptor-associated protein
VSQRCFLGAHEKAALTSNRKIWNTYTGELLYNLQHDHIVRAVAYPFDNSGMIATGGFEKKLRIFDLQQQVPVTSPGTNGGEPTVTPVTITTSQAFEIGEGVHTEPIKFIVWAHDHTVLITASGNTLRWFDLPSRQCTRTEKLDGEIKSCELVSLAPSHSSPSDIGGGLPVLAVAAAKTVYFWGGKQADKELKRITLKHGIASVGLDVKGRKFVVGEDPGTWAHVYRWDDATEIGE